MKATEQKVLRFIKENDLIKLDDKILIALSGGPDSIFLLHFLNKYKNKFKIKLSAVHINHLLRGKVSDRDELFCEAVCEELNLPFYSSRKNVKVFAKKNKLSIELAARKIRYSVFEKLVKKNSFDKIATAHVADDNVETVLLNLIKGAGLSGIAGIPVKRGNIIRPVLCLTKKEILDYLAANKFEFRIDESNLSNEYERNFLRNEIIPLIKSRLNPAVERAVLNTSINLQEIGVEIDKLNPVKSLSLRKNKSVTIPASFFSLMDIKTSLHTLKTKIDKNFGIKLQVGDIKKIISLRDKQPGSSEELSFRLIAQRNRNGIFLTPKTELISNVSKTIKANELVKIGDETLSIEKVKSSKAVINADPKQEYISADGISSIFHIRNWKNGDRFSPIGMKGTKKVSDYLNDIKMDPFKKQDQLVLINNSKIVWIIGKRLDDRFKITSATKKVLKLCLK
jgi:tRNA(Ile)-lysidine synthase